MPEFTTTFIISQVLIFGAMLFDFLSFQFKERKKTIVCLAISSCFISTHYLLLEQIPAGIMVGFSIVRFIVSYFSTDKRRLLFFIGLNTVSLFFTYKVPIDLLFYVGVTIFMIGNFQANNKLMRQLMMCGTASIILYNILIPSPMGALNEAIFLTSNFIGYRRFYMRKNISDIYIKSPSTSLKESDTTPKK
ncbi:MAG: YgjV family protein [Candidatus Peribacteria bacterium]|jgi:hypothetical protein|nr:YgjV family protein [Candidatus Peribacteria bacterium]